MTTLARALCLGLLALATPVCAIRKAGPGLWRYDLLDGRLTRLGDGISVSWSRAARRLVYLQRVDEHTSRLCTMSRDGTGRRVLVDKVKPLCSWAQYSADGRYIATAGVDGTDCLDATTDPEGPGGSYALPFTVYSSQGALVYGPALLASLGHEDYQPIGECISWSPSGHRLVLAPHAGDDVTVARLDCPVPYILDPATSRKRPLSVPITVSDEEGRHPFRLAEARAALFTGTGSRVALVGYDGVVSIAAAGEPRPRLLADRRRSWSLAPVPGSPDLILLDRVMGFERQPRDMRRIASDGRCLRRWTAAGDWNGAMAATRTRVCFWEQTEDGLTLSLADADGTVKQCVRMVGEQLNEVWAYEPPSWSSDGVSIFFWSGTEWPRATPDGGDDEGRSSGSSGGFRRPYT